VPTDNERYPYWPLPERPAIRWPNNARVAFWIIPNIEHFRFDKVSSNTSLSPDVYEYAQRDYGARVGIWRMMDIMDKYGMRATVALNADICRFEPQIIKAGVERKWEWMGHGITTSQRLVGLAEADERKLIQSVVTTIKDSTGARRRAGWAPGSARPTTRPTCSPRLA